jgi:hypothetical protein
VSSESSTQVPPSSIDRLGLSVATSSQDIDIPRQGVIYDPINLGAGRLVHIHPSSTDYVALFKERWHGGTLGLLPQHYTSHSVDLTPYWVLFNPVYGTIKYQGPIPTRSPYTSRVLQAATSRNDYLFTLESRDGEGFIQHFRNTQGLGIELMEEETIPRAGEVVFDKGLFCWKDLLCVYGTDDSGKLYVIRKPWSRIGVMKNAGDTAVWRYQTDRGWSLDPLEAVPINISSEGPVSYASYRDKSYLSVHSDGAINIYVSRGLYDPWKKVKTYPNTEDFYFQTHLALSEFETVMGFLYITSTGQVEGSEESISVSWGKFTPV